ncbi:uncharacterized protein RSE6_02427 [Rhynchosporium secalis]|uniref:Uncharacterized protein n=1 Tax=Rhynchosporium secalis TaxID=38038 RepID=A0A1E1M071_RHYSE|nr:uncharacterized protein RSE6_02427 [Rhynchosporium secalis]
MPGFSPSGHARLEVLVTKIEVYKESYGRNEEFASIEDLRGADCICAVGGSNSACAAEIPAKSSLGRNSEA